MQRENELNEVVVQGRRRLLKSLLVGGLMLAAAPLATACGGTQTTASGNQVSKPAVGEAKPVVAKADGPTVDMNDQNQYVPAALTVKKGTAVTWKNVGTMIHNVQTDPTGVIDPRNARVPSGAKPFASPMINGGSAWSYTFEAPGEYAYFCLPHQALGMIGKVTVTE